MDGSHQRQRFGWWVEYIHLSKGIIITEDALEINVFKKYGEVNFELMKINLCCSLRDGVLDV